MEKTDPDQAQTSSSMTEMQGRDGGMGTSQEMKLLEAEAKHWQAEVEKRREAKHLEMKRLEAEAEAKCLEVEAEERRQEKRLEVEMQAKHLELEIELKCLELERAKMGPPEIADLKPQIYSSMIQRRKAFKVLHRRKVGLLTHFYLRIIESKTLE
ncbi:unnamed protein product [Caretta caretta]